MAAITKKLIDLLLKPFREHFLFLISFFVLATSSCALLQFFSLRRYFNAILVLNHCFVLSYLVALIIGLIQPKLIRKIVQIVILVISALDFACNIYCIFELGYLFDSDFAMLILNTDLHESKEFATTLIPNWMIFTVLSIYLIFLILWVLSHRHNLNLGKHLSKVALCIMCLCVIENVYSWPVWQEGPIKRISELPEYEAPRDLESYYTHPRLTFKEHNIIPNNIILIIGESFTRCHSSLYGYEKETNPQLKEYKNRFLLFTFDSVNSPASMTTPSIKFMMSTYAKHNEGEKDKKWYEFTSIIELMQISGYNCCWYSNQGRGSKSNSPSRAFAESCDMYSFLQNEGAESSVIVTDKKFDMVLVDSSYVYASHIIPEQHHFIIYHMMGSHFDYRKRYPKEFSKFTENDYPDHPQHHRNTLAAYDNSILYNDYVVSQIINLYKDKEAVIIYLPDHGQVMYRDPNMPDHYVHGKTEDKDSESFALGVEIPMIVFTSSLFQERHPDTMERIKYRQDNPKSWNSDDLPYFIMDLIGVKEINGENIQSKSIIN